MNFVLKFLKSFLYAAKGIGVAMQGRNFKVQLLAVVIVSGAGFHFSIENWEWVAIVLCCGMVLTAEAMNTAIELLVDKVEPEYDQLAGKIKDVAAGAVLLVALSALVVAIIIFYEHILALL